MDTNPPAQDVDAEIAKVQREQEDRDTYESFQDDGKIHINELLHRCLPGGTTIRELEDLAILFHDKIRDAWEASEHWSVVNK